MTARKDYIEFANTLRGIAALMVLAAHYLGAFWSNPAGVGILSNSLQAEIASYTPLVSVLTQKLALFINLGAFGVAVFFLVSGFVIPLSLIKKSSYSFFKGRVRRIFPTYFAGFSITILSLWLSSLYFSNPFPYSFKEVAIHYIPGLRDILWSRHIDGIVWTLEIELKFYLVCGLCISLFRKNSYFVFLIPVFGFLISIWVLYQTTYILSVGSIQYKIAYIFTYSTKYICFMFIGVAMNYLYRDIISSVQAIILSLVLILLMFILWFAEPFRQSLHVIVNYMIAIIVFGLSYFYRGKFSFNRLTNFFANISYPLYVSHAIFGYVFMSILLDRKLDPNIAILLTTCSSIAIAWFLHKYVEKSFMRSS